MNMYIVQWYISTWITSTIPYGSQVDMQVALWSVLMEVTQQQSTATLLDQCLQQRNKDLEKGKNDVLLKTNSSFSF